MLSDARTWTTLLYLVLMLPLGIIYFMLAAVGLSAGLRLVTAPFVALADTFGWLDEGWWTLNRHEHVWWYTHSLIGSLFMCAFGVLVLTLLMHLARAIGRGHARLAKALLVEPGS
jgi:hypothetical protein